MNLRVVVPTLLLSAVCVSAQPPIPITIAPGSLQVDTTRIRPYQARWKETIVNALHQVIARGTWDDQLTRESVKGVDVFVRTIRVAAPDGSMREYYRTVVDAKTFAPMTSEWRNGLGLSYSYEYSGTGISGRRVNAPGADPVRITATVPRPGFDFYGGMMELFLATLPRQPRGLFSFPALLTTSGHDADQSGLHWPVVEVFPEETTFGAGGAPVKAVRMEANTRYGFYKVWVTDTAPFVVRTVLLLGPGGRITYELM